MRLTDLDPRWLTPEGWHGKLGVDFKCPCGCGARIPIWFQNPIYEGDRIESPYGGVTLWIRDGETFETLTLDPSVRVSCWHGWIKNGEVRKC